MRFCLTLVTIVSETSIISVELISHITTIVELSAGVLWDIADLLHIFKRLVVYESRVLYIRYLH